MGKINTTLDRGFKIYPRGFLGSIDCPVVERSDKPKYNTKLTVDLSLFSNGKSVKITANTTVDELFKEIQVFGSGSFERREKMLKAGLFAFGTLNFHNWFINQFQSPSFGDMHQRFIEDTIGFILTGNRQIALSAWVNLLEPDEANNNKVEYGPNAKKLFLVYENGQVNNKPSVTDVIHQWLKQEGGFNDLAHTLHILFGVPE